MDGFTPIEALRFGDFPKGQNYNNGGKPQIRTEKAFAKDLQSSYDIQVIMSPFLPKMICLQPISAYLLYLFSIEKANI